MSINVFEGGWRVRSLVQILFLGSCVASGLAFDPSTNLTFETAGPDKAWTVATSECGEDDASRTIYSFDLGNGMSMSATLCFRADTRFRSIPHIRTSLVPYKTEGGDVNYVFRGHRPEPADYFEKQTQKFSLTKGPLMEARRRAKEQRSREYTENWKSEAFKALMGVVGLYIAAWAIGWMVRGFAGIPRRADHRGEHLRDA